MKRPLTPTESRLLAVALLVAVLATAGFAVYLPWKRAHAHYDAAIEDTLDHLARYRRIAAQRASIEANIAALRKRNAGRFYLTASAPALAASEIQQKAQAIVEANALKVESTQIGTHKDEGWRRRVTVNFRLTGPWPAVHKALYEIESTVPYLYLENLSILSGVTRAFRHMPGVEPDIQVQFDVYAYARLPAPDARKKP